MVKRFDTLTLDIAAMDFHGQGVGRAENMAIFVPGAVPGERVTAQVTKAKPHYAEAALRAVESAAHPRSQARCTVFGQCGGCYFQHVPYTQQLEYKKYALLGQLRQLSELPDIQMLACEAPWRYRNKMEFAFARGAIHESPLRLGLRRRGSFDDVLDVSDCWLQSEAANRARLLTRDYFSARPYPVYDLQAHQGLLRFLVLRESQHPRAIMLMLVVADSAPFSDEDLKGWVDVLRAGVPELASVYLAVQSTHSDTAVPESLKCCWGAEQITERLGDHDFAISPLSFFQTNSAQAERLLATVLDAAEAGSTDTVLDLYCGAGSLSLALAARAGRVFGVESVPEAIADAKRNAACNGVKNVTFISDRVETWLKWNGDELAADCWVLDPPRSGLHPAILQKRLPMLAQKPRRIVYVSCNPGHLGPDLKRFSEWYQISTLVAVDMFPHTSHLEVVAKLDLKSHSI